MYPECAEDVGENEPNEKINLAQHHFGVVLGAYIYGVHSFAGNSNA